MDPANASCHLVYVKMTKVIIKAVNKYLLEYLLYAMHCAVTLHTQPR